MCGRLCFRCGSRLICQRSTRVYCKHLLPTPLPTGPSPPRRACDGTAVRDPHAACGMPAFVPLSRSRRRPGAADRSGNGRCGSHAARADARHRDPQLRLVLRRNPGIRVLFRITGRTFRGTAVSRAAPTAPRCKCEASPKPGDLPQRRSKRLRRDAELIDHLLGKDFRGRVGDPHLCC
jgi:hypothetical protein